ncbi:MAG: tryptophan 7-halogenase, partial [Candidatus Margulisbacteria bacterium]|nr:tryptophan 7-halogenase [Candidatus Margulisiibacteriota bacterium]
MFLSSRSEYDVIILGSGFGGSILSAILSQHGGRVLVIDEKSHPRFAIGESTIPQTSQLITLLANKYKVPELNHLGLGSPDGIWKQIGHTCGIKRIFGFAYHEKGENHDPNQGFQFGNVWRDENHLFRQDVDAYLLRVAISYGATVLQDTKVESVDIDEEKGVTVVTNKGETFQAEYLVDGSGYRSIVAEKYGLREKPARFSHHSRTIFTHMIDVAPFEDVVEN